MYIGTPNFIKLGVCHQNPFYTIIISWCVYSSTGDDTLLLCVSSLRQKMLSNDELLLPIEVRRDFVLLDALREARKKKFDPRKYLKV